MARSVSHARLRPAYSRRKAAVRMADPILLAGMRLLLAEDDVRLRSLLRRGLIENGYVVDEVERGDDALHLFRLYEYAVAVLDWRMPGLDGVEVVRAVRG